MHMVQARGEIPVEPVCEITPPVAVPWKLDGKAHRDERHQIGRDRATLAVRAHEVVATEDSRHVPRAWDTGLRTDPLRPDQARRHLAQLDWERLDRLPAQWRQLDSRLLIFAGGKRHDDLAKSHDILIADSHGEMIAGRSPLLSSEARAVRDHASLNSLTEQAILAAMLVATITEAKNSLSALISRVRGGESVLIVDRGIPVARLESAVGGHLDAEGKIARLERAGTVRAARKPPASDVLATLPPESGASAVAALLDERRSGR